ncbi:MAG: DsbA family protein [Pseudomonadota bacterium]
MLKRLYAAGTAVTLLLTPAHALDLGAMSDDERALFREEVRAYLMENPQVIMDAVRALEERQAEVQAEEDTQIIAANADAIFDDGFSFVGGNPEGDVTLVEFMDYRCGFCKRAYNEVEQLLENDGNIRFVIKEFPILGEQSVLASRYAIATRIVAGDQAYKALHDALMVYNGEITIAALRRLAETYALDSEAIEARMQDGEVTEELAATRALAQQLRISGTPSFILEDEVLRGFLPADQMQALVDDLRG